MIWKDSKLSSPKEKDNYIAEVLTKGDGFKTIEVKYLNWLGESFYPLDKNEEVIGYLGEGITKEELEKIWAEERPKNEDMKLKDFCLYLINKILNERVQEGNDKINRS